MRKGYYNTGNMSTPSSFTDGHRQRLRERFLSGGRNALADYELLELILFAAKTRGDVKPLAKTLLKTFRSFTAVIHASEAELARVKGLGTAGIAALKAVKAALECLLYDEIKQQPVLASWPQVLNYCKVTMENLTIEQLRLLFLDRQHRLIRDEVQNQGTIDHTPVYIREIIKRALELGASGLIIVHNHPSGDPTPSRSDITITQDLREAAETVSLFVMDHIIVGKGAYYSFRSHGLL
jgi:DNA repair protein RadC